MAAVWCAGDRREALERAVRGEEVTVRAGSACSDAVISKHYELGQKLGIPGTPMIVLGDGTALGGYVMPDKIVVTLAEHAQSTRGKSHE